MSKNSTQLKASALLLTAALIQAPSQESQAQVAEDSVLSSSQILNFELDEAALSKLSDSERQYLESLLETASEESIMRSGIDTEIMRVD